MMMGSSTPGHLVHMVVIAARTHQDEWYWPLAMSTRVFPPDDHGGQVANRTYESLQSWRG